MISLKKSFNQTLAIMSLLNGYAFSFFRGFSLAMIISTAFAVLALTMYIREGMSLSKGGLILFCCFAVVETVVSIYFVDFVDYKRMVYIILKLFIWAIYVTMAGKLYFDYYMLLSYIKNVIIVTFIYLCFQYIAHFLLHMSLPVSFNLGIIKANSTDYEYIMESSNKVFRPGSLWLEPGYLGYYYNGFLAICLFDPGSVKKVTHYYTVIKYITCIGILMSMSSGAMGTMVILILVSIINKNKKNLIYTLLSVICIVTLIICFFKFNWIEAFKGISPSFDNTIWKLQNLDKVGRIGASFELLNLLSTRSLLFGLGLGNELFITLGGYMNGIVTLVMWVGYLGLTVWILLFFYMGKRYCKTLVQKVMLYTLLFSGIFAGLYFGAHSFIYLIVALYMDDSVREGVRRYDESTYFRT